MLHPSNLSDATLQPVCRRPRTPLWRTLLLMVCVCATLGTAAQTRQISNLKSKRTQLEQGLQQNRTKLRQTQQQRAQKQQKADYLEEQVRQRLAYISQLEHEIDSLDRRVAHLERQLAQLDSQLQERKHKYVSSLRMARHQRAFSNPVLFVASAKTFTQVLRRLRYAKEYATLQRTLGMQLVAKQNEVRDMRNQLLGVKQQRAATMNEVIRQRKQLAEEHSLVTRDVAALRKRQQEIEHQVAQQQRQLAELNKKIDELVAYEIEQARKRAEAEARRKAEAERQRQAAGKGKTGTAQPSRRGGGTPPARWLTSEDRQLNGSLEQNKGRLPVPVTGPYRIARRFGMNQVAAGVTLDNKGVNYMGQEGARARAIFDGEVSAVFQLGNMQNVLVRHGSYISVYCNLSSTIVKRGQKVKARDILGTVARDEQGNYILHFQLRQETRKLNPEQWIGR